MADVDWNGLGDVGKAQGYRCAFCDREVASNRGWVGFESRYEPGSGHHQVAHYVLVCPRCTLPTLAVPNDNAQVPRASEGEPVNDLPPLVANLYQEARRSLSADANTGAVLLARKLLMNVAVEKGAEAGKTFQYYVDYLTKTGLVTEEMKDWVDEIREFGNDANHELPEMTHDEAVELLTFVAMLLQVVYEYPAKGRRAMEARKAKDEATEQS